MFNRFKFFNSYDYKRLFFLKSMQNMIEYINNFMINLGLKYCILIMSFFFLSLSLFYYFYKSKWSSFLMFYVGSTYLKLFLNSVNHSWAITILYVYYLSIFLAYHLFFTFSKRFYFITIIVIKQYLKGSEYVKLLLWFVFVFTTSLLLENFILFVLISPLMGFTLTTSNFLLLFFLLCQWLWMCLLVFFNKYNIHMN